jgi:hypothetical protein
MGHAGNRLLGAGDVEKARDAVDLAEQVAEQVAIVHEEDVVQGAVRPPGLGVVQVAPVGIAFALPGKPASGDPVPPELVELLPRRR